MIVSLPIHPEFNGGEHTHWINLLHTFPGGIGSLATLALVWSKEKHTFIEECQSQFADSVEIACGWDDNDLTKHNAVAFDRLIYSDGFMCFLDAFFDLQNELYARIFGPYTELEVMQLPSSRRTTFQVKILGYERSL